MKINWSIIIFFYSLALRNTMSWLSGTISDSNGIFTKALLMPTRRKFNKMHSEAGLNLKIQKLYIMVQSTEPMTWALILRRSLQNCLQLWLQEQWHGSVRLVILSSPCGWQSNHDLHSSSCLVIIILLYFGIWIGLVCCLYIMYTEVYCIL